MELPFAQRGHGQANAPSDKLDAKKLESQKSSDKQWPVVAGFRGVERRQVGKIKRTDKSPKQVLISNGPFLKLLFEEPMALFENCHLRSEAMLRQMSHEIN